MKTVLLDFRTSEIEKENLYKLGYNTLIVPPSELLYEAVCGHPDMLLHILDEKNMLLHNKIAPSFISELNKLGYKTLLSEKQLKNSYPEDIVLNALSINNLFLHNLKFTDPILKANIKNKKLINVKQGYTKCSTAIITDFAAMTSDIGIYKSLVSEGIDVLLLPPGDIELPGLSYGFIGGGCGLLEEGLIGFFGDLTKYVYGKEVIEFLIKHDVKPVFLRNDNLVDRGTLFRLPQL